MGVWACGLLRNGKRRNEEIKSEFIKMSYCDMKTFNTMGFRVTTGALMYLWAVG